MNLPWLKQPRGKKLVAALAVICAGVANAGSFQDMYLAALHGDPVFAAARAEREAADSLVTQARGQLLPQVAVNGARIKNSLDNQVQTTLYGTVRRNYDFVSHSASLNLSQALFRPQAWLAYNQSKSQVLQAEGIYRQAAQDLTLRFSQAYFEVLLAEDNLALSKEQKLAIEEQLKQAKRYFEAGVGTITDINEVQARYDTIQAQELAADNNLELKIRSLEQIAGDVGRKFQRISSGMELELPQPSDVNAWLEFSLANNPSIKAREAALAVAESEVHKNFAAHLPTVDLVASRGRNENPGYTTLDTVNWTNTLGVQFSIPLFAGGTTQGRVNQSASLREKARYDLEATRRAVIQSTRQEYLNVINGVAQIKALRQAVKSNELALYSARKGLEAGLRTSFDVLNAQQLVFSAKRDLALERYRYVSSRLRLRAAAGMLGDEDIALVQNWLSLN